MTSPPGLEPLYGVTHLFVERDMNEMYYNAPTRLKVTTNFGSHIYDVVPVQNIYTAASAIRNIKNKPYTLVVSSHETGQQVLEMTTEFGKYWGDGTSGMSIGIGGKAIGHVDDICRTSNSCCWSKPKDPNYKVISYLNQRVLDIIPTNKTCCNGVPVENPTFNLISADGTRQVIGRIGQNWGTCMGETVDAVLGVAFPADMDVSTKAMLLGAVLLLNFQTYNKDEYVCVLYTY